jgi:hypothetical protein
MTFPNRTDHPLLLCFFSFSPTYELAALSGLTSESAAESAAEHAVQSGLS